MFPKTRHRRLRISPSLRQMVRETRLLAANLLMPYFVVEGREVRRPIASMPGHAQLSVDQLIEEVGEAQKLGILAVILFGLPAKKDREGSQAYAKSGISQKAIRALKKEYPKLIVMADLCFCEYTSHGHCGIVKKNTQRGWDVDNDATLALLRKAAVAQARAGVDVVAPSGMIDGAVAVIRDELDKKGFTGTGILAYAAKYSSVFYGPFREAAASTPRFGDRRSYQMDPANVREAIEEIRDDVAEGADMVMVKPALPYLDVIARVRPELNIPLVAYNVSGEFAMVKAAEKLGWLEGGSGPQVALEVLTSIKRAGADLIITYHALEVATYLRKRGPIVHHS